jgi:hypothetical protein
MADTGSDSDFESLDELRLELGNAVSERDSWRTQAHLHEKHLNRILTSPAWKITKPFRIVNLIAWKVKPSLKHVETQNWIPDSKGKTVFDIVKNESTFECNNAKLDVERIAYFAQWSSSEKVSTSTQRLIKELMEFGYSVVLISACESPKPLDIDDDIRQKITIIRKPNIGYDFGSWSVAMQLLPTSRSAGHVIVVNDSLVGPFTGLYDLFSALESSPYDVTGITDSIQMRHHVQSYLLHFKNGSFQNPGIVDFWNNIFVQEDKMEVIKSYELGLTAKAQAANLFVGALYPWNLVGQYWHNPSVDRWMRLIDLGFPFVKREVVREANSKTLKSLVSKVDEKFSIGSDFDQEILGLRNSASN